MDAGCWTSNRRDAKDGRRMGRKEEDIEDKGGREMRVAMCREKKYTREESGCILKIKNKAKTLLR